MIDFKLIKQHVTARQAAETYGLTVLHNGMARCPFHDDKTPSLKLDERYYCFGCHATGDAIDFTANFFHIGLREAAGSGGKRGFGDIHPDHGGRVPGGGKGGHDGGGVVPLPDPGVQQDGRSRRVPQRRFTQRVAQGRIGPGVQEGGAGCDHGEIVPVAAGRRRGRQEVDVPLPGDIEAVALFAAERPRRGAQPFPADGTDENGQKDSPHRIIRFRKLFRKLCFYDTPFRRILQAPTKST